MVMFLYSVYDYKVESFSTFFVVSHDAQAERMFADVATDRETIIGRNPKDFALVRIGRIETDTGKVYAEEPAPKFLRTAYSFLAENDSDEKTDDS